MSSFAARMVATAKRLVDKYGVTAVFSEPGSETYDPQTGQTTYGADTDHTVKVSPPSGFSPTLVDGSMIQARDVKVTLPASGLLFTPAPAKQKVTIDGVVYEIIGVQPVTAQDTAISYDLHLR